MSKLIKHIIAREGLMILVWIYLIIIFPYQIEFLAILFYPIYLLTIFIAWCLRTLFAEEKQYPEKIEIVINPASENKVYDQITN